MLMYRMITCLCLPQVTDFSSRCVVLCVFLKNACWVSEWVSEWVTVLVSYITTDGQSASVSWCQVPIWGLWPDFYYCQIIAGLLMWGALSDERTGLSFTLYNVQYI
jgi:hypothetical protein